MDDRGLDLASTFMAENGGASPGQADAQGAKGSHSEDGAFLKTSLKMMAEFVSNNPGDVGTVRSMGHDFGLELAGKIEPAKGSLGDVISGFASYWSAVGIGKMKWTDREGGFLKVTQKSYSVVENVSKIQRCAFVEGLLEALLKEKTGARFEVRETRCSVFREHSCTFRICSKP